MFQYTYYIVHYSRKRKKNILIFATYIILLLSKIRTIFLGMNRAIYSYVLKSTFKTNLLSIQWHSIQWKSSSLLVFLSRSDWSRHLMSVMNALILAAKPVEERPRDWLIPH